jgi:hypothetical protein
MTVQILGLISILFAAPDPATALVPCTIRHPLVISDSAVGRFRLGATLAQTRQLCPSAVDTSRTNHDYVELERGLLVVTGRGDSLWLALSPSLKVDRIDVLTPGPRTGNNLRVGSRLSDLLVPGTSGGVGEASFWVHRPDYPGVAFVMGGEPVDVGDDLAVSTAALSRSPQAMRVVKIQVHGHPTEE